MSHENGLSFVCDRMCRTMCSLFLKAWSHCGHFHPLDCRPRSLRGISAPESFALRSSATAATASAGIVITWGCGECPVVGVWETHPRIPRDCMTIYRWQQNRTSDTKRAELGVSALYRIPCPLHAGSLYIPKCQPTMTFTRGASSTRF